MSGRLEIIELEKLQLDIENPRLPMSFKSGGWMKQK